MNSFWRLMGYVRNYKGQITLSIICNILTAIFTALSIPLLIPFINILFQVEDTQQVVPANPPAWEYSLDALNNRFNYELMSLIQTQGKETALAYVCGMILSIFFLKNIFQYFSLFFMAPVRNGIIRDIRAQIFDKLLVLPLSYFSKEKKGDLLSRVTADVQEIESSILNVLISFFREPLVILGSLAFMLYVSPGLTGFIFLLLAFTVFIVGGIGRTLKRKSSIVQQHLGQLVSIVEETLGGLRIIKGFNAESYQEKKFDHVNSSYRWTLTRLLWRRDLSSPLSEFLGIAVVAILLWYGSRQVFSGVLEAATFLTFIYAFYRVIEPAKSISKAYYNVQKGIAAVQRIEEILDAPNTIHDPENPAPLNTFERAIEYKEVHFAYNADEGEVLKDINLFIPKGKVVALVGASGAGKSTLVDLLPRFYDVTAGEISIDGMNIQDYKLDDLRNLMGIVSQEAILFNDTIYNNIVFGLENVTQGDVEKAARIANAHEFIMGTENGYQTNIGDRGNQLSGGQRQRLTIARAILKNPPILILDEATSALDSESEKLVQEALVKLMKNRTSIVIAHRLSTIQHADEIIVMRDGKILEQGSHQDLLEVEGEYQKLVSLQAF